MSLHGLIEIERGDAVQLREVRVQHGSMPTDQEDCSLYSFARKYHTHDSLAA